MPIWQQLAHFFLWPETEFVKARCDEMLAREARRYKFFGWMPWFSGLFTGPLLAAYEANDADAFADALLDVKYPVAYQQIGHLKSEDAGIRWHTSDDGKTILYGPGPVFQAPPDDGPPFTVG